MYQMSDLIKSLTMKEKTTIQLAVPVVKCLQFLCKKTESYEDHLIENLPGLKEWLIENGDLLDKPALKTALEMVDAKDPLEGTGSV